MGTLIFVILFLAGITLISALLWSFYLIIRGEEGAVELSQVIIVICIIFFPCTVPVVLALFTISLPLIPIILTVSVIALALLPFVFVAYWLKNRFFPTSNFRTLFEVDSQQNSLNSSYASSSNDLEQVGAEEISSNNSMPVFLRKRAQRLGLTPTPSPSPNASNSQPVPSVESSQPVPGEQIDPTLLPPSEDIPGQTVYRRIIPIQP